MIGRMAIVNFPSDRKRNGYGDAAQEILAQAVKVCALPDMSYYERTLREGKSDGFDRRSGAPRRAAIAG